MPLLVSCWFEGDRDSIACSRAGITQATLINWKNDSPIRDGENIFDTLINLLRANTRCVARRNVNRRIREHQLDVSVKALENDKIMGDENTKIDKPELQSPTFINVEKIVVGGYGGKDITLNDIVEELDGDTIQQLPGAKKEKKEKKKKA